MLIDVPGVGDVHQPSPPPTQDSLAPPPQPERVRQCDRAEDKGENEATAKGNAVHFDTSLVARISGVLPLPRLVDPQRGLAHLYLVAEVPPRPRQSTGLRS